MLCGWRCSRRKPIAGSAAFWSASLMMRCESLSGKAGSGSTEEEIKFAWSGRRGSNPQPTAWEAATLPLSYSRSRWKFDGSRLAASLKLEVITQSNTRNKKYIRCSQALEQIKFDTFHDLLRLGDCGFVVAARTTRSFALLKSAIFIALLLTALSSLIGPVRAAAINKNYFELQYL